MKVWRKVLGIKFGLILAISSLFGLFFVSAQTEKPVPSPQTQTAPTPTPTPQVSASPEEPVIDDEPITVDTELVNILFTATDKTKRILTELKAADVRILEDGKPQEIFAFQRQVDLPLSIAILIDTSVSQERTLPDEKAAAQSFINDVVRIQKDEVAVLSFTGETTLEQSFTGNKQRLSRAIERIEFVAPSGYAGGGVTVGTPPISGRNSQIAGSTAIWDAIDVTSREILTGEAPEGTRRAIILLSDGVDTFSRIKFDAAVQSALKADAVIYCIGIGDDYRFDGVNESVMRRLAEKTGGRAYFPESESELRRAFTQIQIDLRSQYLLAYAPSNEKKDGTFRQIKIEITNPNLKPQDVKLTHRQGYFAKTEKDKKKK